jgi:hypothetical protein
LNFSIITNPKKLNQLLGHRLQNHSLPKVESKDNLLLMIFIELSLVQEKKINMHSIIPMWLFNKLLMI